MNCKQYILLIFIACFTLIFLSGCSEREEPAVAPGSTAKADEALKKAEEYLKAVGIPISFEDPGELAHPEDLIPDPSKLGSEDIQRNSEEAIKQLNIVISEIEQGIEASPPSMGLSTPPTGSTSDRVWVHFYLGLAYLFDALSRLLISDDPAETFIIKYDPESETGVWFSFGVSEEVQAKLDATEDSLDYPLAFTPKERQAIIDSADLVADATVKPRAQDIQPQTSSVDRLPYSKFAIWHFKKASSLVGQYNPDLKETLDDFNRQIDDLESVIQEDSEKWGFTYTPSPWR